MTIKEGGKTRCFGKQKSVSWDEDIRRILPGETITFHNAYVGSCGYILPHSLIPVNETLFPKDYEKVHRRPQRKPVIVRQKYIHVNPPNFQTFLNISF